MDIVPLWIQEESILILQLFITHRSNKISRKILKKYTFEWKSKSNLSEFEEYSKRCARGTFIALNVHSIKDERSKFQQ